MIKIVVFIMMNLQNTIRRVSQQSILPINPLHASCGDYNNWVNDKVICGPYPGVDGINYPTENAAVANLRHLLDNGVTVFVSLQAETSPQSPDDPGTIDSHFKWAFPKYLGYAYLIKKYQLAENIIYLNFPIKDCSVPTHTEFLNNITVLLEHFEKRSIFIHCAGGHGRTGLYVACLLLTLNNISHYNALYLTQQLHDARKVMDKRQRSKMVPCPSTPAQIKFVQHYKHFLSFFTRTE